MTNEFLAFTLSKSGAQNEIIREPQTIRERAQDSPNQSAGNSQMTLAEFVENKFIPEHVASKRSAGRAHFQSMLKHVLTPELVDRAFGVEQRSRAKLTTVPGWPYLDPIPLREVRPDHIQQIIAATLEHGYSTQTAIHIRNVLRKVFSHACTQKCFDGINPATLVVLPHIIRKEAHDLTMDQLQKVVQNLRYPEREIALLVILTDMSVAEICGLQWKYVNLLDSRRIVGEEWIPPKTIAIRKQSYRSELTVVMGGRKRFVSIPDLLLVTLRSLTHHKRFRLPDTFVFSSRSGSPVNQDNIAARRLKPVGKWMGMPWLSWSVFHRTKVNMTSQFGKHFHDELVKISALGRSGLGPA